MELFSNLTFSIISRSENNYNELNDNINKLLDDLGEKIQNDLVAIQENLLLGFKDSLLTAQQEYRQLQKTRNDQVVKEKVLELKNQQERIFSQEEIKSLQMNKLYDKIKVDLKRNVEYEHQLQLEIKFLNKQVAMAQKRTEVLDLEISQYKEQKIKRKDSIRSIQKSFQLPSLKKTHLYRKSEEEQRGESLTEKRMRIKIETMKEYIQLLCQQESTIEKIFSRFDTQACTSQIKKEQLVETIFGDQEFKKYLYQVMFGKKKGQNKRS